LVFDLGGGTFDVSILDFGDCVVEVQATSGDTDLCGNDFDRRMVAHLADEFQCDNGIDLRQDPQDASKKALSAVLVLICGTLHLVVFCQQLNLGEREDRDDQDGHCDGQ
jgi:hypothetical protein